LRPSGLAAVAGRAEAKELNRSIQFHNMMIVSLLDGRTDTRNWSYTREPGSYEVYVLSLADHDR
jgi:hypothetical protein